MKFTVGIKIRLGFICILLCLIAIGAVSVLSMMEMGNKTKQIQTNHMPSMKLLGEIKADFLNIQRLALRIVLETDPREMDQLETKVNEVIEHIQKSQSAYEPLISSKEERERFDAFLKEEQHIADLFPSLVKAGKANDFGAANKIAGEMKVPFNEALDTVSRLVEINTSEVEKAALASVRLNESGTTLVNVISLVALVFGMAVFWVIPRMIVKPIVHMSMFAKRIASGDLTVERIRVKNKDEIGELAASFNDMADSLRMLIREVGRSAEHVAASAEELTTSSGQISATSEQIALTMEEVSAGTMKQASSIDESAKSMNELSAGVRQIAGNAESATNAAIEASELAEVGDETIRTTVSQMNSIQDTVSELAQAVQRLGTRSQEIGQIVEVITAIASQTNLLSLNAAIEAARVGEHGSGFAIVATEVRKLAEQSANSAEQIAQLIADIQAETGHAVHIMEKGTQEVAAGISAVNTAGEAFGQIRNSVNAAAHQIQEVSAASQQMSAGTAQVVHSIDVIAGIAENASSGAQQVSSALEEQVASMEDIASSADALAALSEDLQSAIKQFKV